MTTPAVREATKKAIQNKLDEKLVKEGYYYDEADAERPIIFSRKFLRGSKGKMGGKPVEFIPKIAAHIRRLFGWKRPDGTRRFRQFFLGIPKKNSKSFTISALSLFLAFADREVGAHCFTAGVELSQARIVWDEAVLMAKSSPALMQSLVIQEKGRVQLGIYHPKSNSFLKPLTKQKKSKEGLDAHSIAFDELHVWPADLWSTLQYATAARRQPMRIIITTAGDDCESFAKKQWDLHRDIQSGKIEQADVLACIYEPDPSDDFEDPAVWRKVNPGMGYSIEEEQFRLEYLAAKRDGREWRNFLRYRLNVWIQGAAAWLERGTWEKCGASYTLDRFRDLRVCAGLDLSRTTDSTSCVILSPPQGIETKYLVWPKIWLPEATALNPIESVDWRTWAQHKFVELTPGNVTDYELVVQYLASLQEQGIVVTKLLYDPHFATDLVLRVQNLTGIEPVAFNQTIANFKAPCAEFERLYESGQLEHPNNPCYSWQMLNTSVKGDVNNGFRPVKPPGTSRNKIDSMIATLEALAGAMAEPQMGDVDVKILV